MARVAPLMIEQHPVNYTGDPFFTLVRFNNVDYLTIVDSLTSTGITFYDVELLDLEGIDTTVEDGKRWHDTDCNIPFSVFLSKNDLNKKYEFALKTIPLDIIQRIIGPVPRFFIGTTPIVKRHKLSTKVRSKRGQA